MCTATESTNIPSLFKQKHRYVYRCTKENRNYTKEGAYLCKWSYLYFIQISGDRLPCAASKCLCWPSKENYNICSFVFGLIFFKCSSKIQLVLNTAKSYMPDERGVEAHLLQAAMVPGKYFASLALLMRVEQNNLLKKSKKQGYKRVAIKSRFPWKITSSHGKSTSCKHWCVIITNNLASKMGHIWLSDNLQHCCKEHFNVSFLTWWVVWCVKCQKIVEKAQDDVFKVLFFYMNNSPNSNNIGCIMM